MTSRPGYRTGRRLAKLAVAGAVAVGTPIALAGNADAAPASVWDRVAQCESGGNWGTNTGNGFSGGLQFTPSTWRAYGGEGSPEGASREQQIAVAERVLAAQGWNAWPACSRKMGLRGEAAEPDNAPAARKVSAPATAGRSGATYTVRRGDTLGKIAKAHGTSVAALYAANRGALSSPHVLRVGASLHV
jgi:hypothetical protein